MATIGLRELRQRAGEIVRRVEDHPRHHRPHRSSAQPLQGEIAIRARTLDLVIADTAQAHDARLGTRNLADFARLESFVDVFAHIDLRLRRRAASRGSGLTALPFTTRR